MLIQRRCPSCREWYEKKLGTCPNCEEPPALPNKWLRTAMLNSHLYDMANKAEKEKRIPGARDARL